MWKFRSFSPKEQTGLEGRIVEIGNLKIAIKNLIAQGGFSCVYLAGDFTCNSKQYAVKHIICNDQESLNLVKKEISVMKSLRNHPNIVMLHAHTIFDMGRTKEAFLVMDYCEKSLVNVLESRGGAGYFVEKKIYLMFRDMCNAVFALHCQSPPIAHRDLKAENLLLGDDRLWKLCDFGSVSTNHKCFDKAEDMGIEEDNIRKHTTPAYRAPEMWDLLRRDIINEKVDIWALGCLLFRMCYLKPAFDGESKLQILNGNYKILDLPNYNSALTSLLKDMLQPLPNARPDITQAWFRINSFLPKSLQKSVPDCPPDMPQLIFDKPQGTPNPANTTQNAPLGAFRTIHDTDESKSGSLSSKFSPTVAVTSSAVNAFMAEFGIGNKDAVSGSPGGKEKVLEAEVKRLREELKQANVEKSEQKSKCEKLIEICKSQMKEIQVLKEALASIKQKPDIKQGIVENNSWQAFPATGATSGTTSWGFRSPSLTENSTGEAKNVVKSTSQPAGWAGF